MSAKMNHKQMNMNMNMNMHPTESLFDFTTMAQEPLLPGQYTKLDAEAYEPSQLTAPDMWGDSGALSPSFFAPKPDEVGDYFDHAALTITPAALAVGNLQAEEEPDFVPELDMPTLVGGERRDRTESPEFRSESPASNFSPDSCDSSPASPASRHTSAPRSRAKFRRGPNGNRVDDMGITVYARKPRANALRPVELPETADTATAKRARNTEAARRSRARKLERMSQLEDRIKELVERNKQLELEVARLRG